MINEIYCSLDPECKDPVGPVQQGTNVRFSIRLDKVSMVDSPKLVIFQIDNWEKRQSIDLKLTHTFLKQVTSILATSHPKKQMYIFITLLCISMVDTLNLGKVNIQNAFLVEKKMNVFSSQSLRKTSMYPIL